VEGKVRFAVRVIERHVENVEEPGSEETVIVVVVRTSLRDHLREKVRKVYRTESNTSELDRPRRELAADPLTLRIVA
jgi:hypothetical protein